MKKPRIVYAEAKTFTTAEGAHFVRVTIINVRADWPIGDIYIMHEEMGPSDDWVDSKYSKATSVLPDSYHLTDGQAQRMGIAAFDSLCRMKLDEINHSDEETQS